MTAVVVVPCRGIGGGTTIFRQLNPYRPRLHAFCLSSSIPVPFVDDDIQTPEDTSSGSVAATPSSTDCSTFFPKKNQILELECESLAFKGKGLCKVSSTGFVVMCDRALPGEKFLRRVTRRKGTYAEVQNLKTLVPHSDLVEAPCEYASDCGGCKMQNLLYEASG